MAESSSADKTEKPSEQKLRKAREQGQVARSKDIAAAVGLLLGLKLLVWMAPHYLDQFGRLFRLALAPLDGQDPLQGLQTMWGETAHEALWLMTQLLLPLLVLPAAVIVAAQLSGGVIFSASLWAPRFSRLNPLGNLGRLFSGKHYSDLAATLMKVAGVLGVLVWLTTSLAGEYVRLQALPLPAALARAADLVMDALLTLASVLALYAVIDLPLQRLFFLRGQRMSKQEVKDEYKQNEGRPEVRQRIRQLQQQIARRSVRKEVPQADVVIVNPEHYAVALRYDSAKAEAPYVVAKGVDEMALYIRRLALDHQVHLLELPPLARALYNSSQVRQQIPASLYQAVAQVLSHVMQLRAFRAGQRRTEPRLSPDLPVPRHLSDPAPQAPSEADSQASAAAAASHEPRRNTATAGRPTEAPRARQAADPAVSPAPTAPPSPEYRA
ncbi:flagellar type III secretion system protein FlhB [Roseateles amylovorans]|uniref:Flagellar type III secretion system protein FlhB n=1 Tax=Roseateles amylovorans TaxID=2978473 RepID=A0ABY6AYT4_9BURK|nr:flagellar type III secretion system protein FlhB [Roseateles amylovorans]UXH76909.1 flagellar type III secretion system protein FlhB [Roseateles amylovorans]